MKELSGKGIGVAVLDTGAFPHMDFENRIWAFRDYIHGREQAYDDNGHGTHVLGPPPEENTGERLLAAD